MVTKNVPVLPHAILNPHSDVFGIMGRAFLKTLAEADEALRDTARLTLAGQVCLLERVRQRIAAATISATPARSCLGSWQRGITKR